MVDVPINKLPAGFPPRPPFPVPPSRGQKPPQRGDGPPVPPPLIPPRAPSVSIPVNKPAETKSVAKSSPPVIHTMRDDLADAKKSGPPVLPAAPAKPITLDATPPLRTGDLPVSNQKLPLPPAGPKLAQVMAPPQLPKRRGKTKWLVFFLLLLVVGGALGGGLWWWLQYYQAGNNNVGVSPETSLTAAQVLPEDSSLIMGYRLKDGGSRQNIQKLWSNNSNNSSAPVADLLNGNPSLLLAQQDIEEFYYVLLPNDPRMYLVVPTSPFIEQTLAEQSHLQALTKGNWRIIHPLSTQSYEEAFVAGTLTDPRSLESADASSPIVWRLSPSFARSLHDNPVAINILAVALADTPLAGTFTSTKDIILFGNGPTAAATPISVAKQDSLLTLLPQDVTFAWLGADLANDLPSWQTAEPGVQGLLDPAVLEQPQVAQLISQLQSPYAYYRREGTGSVEDFGLVVSLPESLSRTIQLGDPALEAALRALLPAITGQPTTVSLAFNDATYGGQYLRYLNIAGSSQAIDYVVTNDHILIASSKEGMFALLDAFTKTQPALPTAANWSALLQRGLVNPGNNSTVLGLIKQPAAVKLLSASAEQVPYLLAIPASGVDQVYGALLIDQAIVNSPPPVPL